MTADISWESLAEHLRALESRLGAQPSEISEITLVLLALGSIVGPLHQYTMPRRRSGEELLWRGSYQPYDACNKRCRIETGL
jgi:hypothetical protein